MNYTALTKRPAVFQRLTGLTITEFESVLDKFKSIFYQEYTAKLANSPNRKRKYGAGRPAELKDDANKLLFILCYVRVYPLFFVQGLMFNMVESGAHYWVHALMPILDKTLGFTHTKPSRSGKSVNEILAEFPELRSMGVLIDGTERPIRKPKDEDKRTTKYSGKKKRHTIKNLVVSSPVDKRVIFLGKTQDGSVHDKLCVDYEKLTYTPPGGRETIPILGDGGFKGLEIPGATVNLPFKKPNGGELTELEKSQNKLFSHFRVSVENAICGVKRSRCLTDVYRNTKKDFDDLLMSVGCGLHNTRVAYRFAKA